MEKYNLTWKDSITHILNPLKTNKKLHFTILNYTLDYTLHLKLWIFIYVNSKPDVEMQNVIRIIV